MTESAYDCWLCHDSGWLIFSTAGVAILTTSAPAPGGKCDVPSDMDIEATARQGLDVRRCHVCGDGHMFQPKQRTASPVLYTIEGKHLDQLRTIADSLRTDILNHGDLVDASNAIMTVIRFAETIHALRGPCRPYIHMAEKKP